MRWLILKLVKQYTTKAKTLWNHYRFCGDQYPWVNLNSKYNEIHVHNPYNVSLYGSHINEINNLSNPWKLLNDSTVNGCVKLGGKFTKQTLLLQKSVVRSNEVQNSTYSHCTEYYRLFDILPELKSSLQKWREW